MSKVTSKKKVKFGAKGHLTKRQTNRWHFSDMPIGTRFYVLNKVNLPGYDLLVYFPDFPPQIDEANGEALYTGYVERGSWKLD